jgi:hypothetical protein
VQTELTPNIEHSKEEPNFILRWSLNTNFKAVASVTGSHFAVILQVRASSTFAPVYPDMLSHLYLCRQRAEEKRIFNNNP